MVPQLPLSRNARPVIPCGRGRTPRTVPPHAQQVIADGIAPRPHGLFPPGDPLLRRLAADPRCQPFEKHLPGEQSCYEPLPKGGWATGDAAAARGVDLRLFYQVGAHGG